MDVTVLTAFPEFFQSFRETSIVGRAVKKGLVSLQIRDLRDWSEGAYRQIDDYSFGGRGGMTLMAPPIEAAISELREAKPDCLVIYPSPQGVVLTQDLVESLPKDRPVVILCGHYEGVDERLVQHCVDLEVSVGDYVLSGGELPAMVFVDAMARLIPGVVGKTLSVEQDSFFDGMLDTAHYTRPADWKGHQVPDVLLSGDDGAIDKWRRRNAASRTLARRPDLLSRASILDYMASEVTLGVIVDPKEPDMVEMVRQCEAVAQAFGLGRLVVAPNRTEELETLRQAMNESGQQGKTVRSLRQMKEWTERKKRGDTLILRLEQEGGLPWLEAKRQLLEATGPVLILWGSTEEDIQSVDLRPHGTIGGALPPAALVSAVLDRFFGSR